MGSVDGQDGGLVHRTIRPGVFSPRDAAQLGGAGNGDGAVSANGTNLFVASGASGIAWGRRRASSRRIRRSSPDVGLAARRRGERAGRRRIHRYEYRARRSVSRPLPTGPSAVLGPALARLRSSTSSQTAVSKIFRRHGPGDDRGTVRPQSGVTGKTVDSLRMRNNAIEAIGPGAVPQL